MNINATDRILDRNFTILHIMKKHTNEVFNSTSEFFLTIFFQQRLVRIEKTKVKNWRCLNKIVNAFFLTHSRRWWLDFYRKRVKKRKDVKNKCYDLKLENFRDLKKNACNESFFYFWT